MLFVEFSSVFNKILLMKLIGKLNTLGLGTTHTGYLYKQTPESSDWQSHPLYISA